MSTHTPPLNGIARAKRRDAGISRKSRMDTFCDEFRRMTADEQATALEVLRQLKRSGAALPLPQEGQAMEDHEQ